MAQSLPAAVSVEWFTWRNALLARYDVVHAHWPELAMRGSGRLRATAQRAMFALWVTRLVVTRTPVVRTVHNTTPHDAGSRLERLLVRWFDSRTVVWIRLNDLTPTPGRGRTVTVAHGHYIDWFAPYAVAPSAPSRILFFGHIRPYKGLDDLLASFTSIDDGQASLRIVGSPQDAAVREQITDAVAHDARIAAELGYVEDSQLAREIGEAQLVVLPYRNLLNSGSMLLSLSLARPVLVPSGPIAAALADEVGAGWVLTYDAPLAAADLRAAIDASAAEHRPTSGPDLSARDWPALGEALYGEYVQAAGLSSRGRRYSE